MIRPFNARLATPLVAKMHAVYADGDTVIAFFDSIEFNDFCSPEVRRVGQWQVPWPVSVKGLPGSGTKRQS